MEHEEPSERVLSRNDPPVLAIDPSVRLDDVLLLLSPRLHTPLVPKRPLRVKSGAQSPNRVGTNFNIPVGFINSIFRYRGADCGSGFDVAV